MRAAVASLFTEFRRFAFFSGGRLVRPLAAIVLHISIHLYISNFRRCINVFWFVDNLTFFCYVK